MRIFDRDGGYRPGEGRPIDTGTDAAVDPRATASLHAAVGDLAASALDPELGRSERLARAERAAEAATAVRRWAGSLDPYADGTHCRLADLLAVAGWPGAHAPQAPQAADRLALARAADAVAHQRATVTLASLPGLDPNPTQPAQRLLTQAPLVDAIAAPAVLGRRPEFPGAWGDLPTAATNDEPQDGRLTVLDIITVPFSTSRYHLPVSRQVAELMPAALAELEHAVHHVVTVGLERQLAAAIADGAPTAPSFADAEAAIGAAGWVADTVLVAVADLPAVKRAYAFDYPDPADRPRILPSHGLDAGTALVFAAAGVHAEASPTEWTIAEAPAVLGRDIGAHRYGRALARVSGVVVKVAVPAAEPVTPAEPDEPTEP